MLWTRASGLDFLTRAVSNNRLVLRAGAIFAIVVEVYNTLLVLCFPNPGIGLHNSRIYLNFYLFYILFCAALLAFDRRWKDKPLLIRHRLYMVCGSVFVIWQLLFSMYDLSVNGMVGNSTFITIMVGLAALFIMRPLYALLHLGLGSLIFIFYLDWLVGPAKAISFTMTACLCGVIYVIRYRSLCEELSQARLLDDVRNELREAQQGFRLSAEQYQMIQEQGGHITFAWDIRSDWIRFSKEWSTAFGQPELIEHFQKYVYGLKTVDARQKEIILTCIRNVRQGVVYQNQELQLPLLKGGMGWFDVRVITQTNASGEPVYGIGMLEDITARKEAISQLEQEIKMDPFTGILNKAAIERYGENRLKGLHPGEMLAILVLDVDNFKAINDRFGHPAGDYVLKRVADRMRKEAPVGARVGRIGGDEFVVLFLFHVPQQLGKDGEEPLRSMLRIKEFRRFYQYAESLMRGKSEVKWQGISIDVHCSVGVSAADSSAWTYAQLYRQVDQALYEAKRAGKKQLKCNFAFERKKQPATCKNQEDVLK